jgi:copper chaperone NosL
VKDIYLTDHAGPHALVKATGAYILKSDKIHGPMNGNLAAFKEPDSLRKYQVIYEGGEVNWSELYK